MDRRLPPLGTPAARNLDARVGAVLFGACGILSLGLSSLGRHPAIVVVVGILSLVSGAGWFLRGGEDEPYAFSAATALTSVLIACLTMAIHRPADIGTGPILYVWVALQMGLMRPVREALLQTTWACALYGLAAFTSSLPMGQASAATIVTTGGLLLLTTCVGFLRSRVDTLLEQLRDQVEHDHLTGLLNRQGLMARIERAGISAGAVVILDVDHFKQVNDRYGHGVGDETLAWLGGLLVAAALPPQAAARYGGEEFLVWLPETGMEDAAEWAERLRAQVATASRTRTCPVTISAGVAVGSSGDLVGLLNRADNALYRAKDGGRNRVHRAGETRIVLS